MSASQPTVNVVRQRGGCFDITASVQLPDCSVDTAYRALSDFNNYTAWNPSLKQFVPVREPAHSGGPSTIRVVQDVGILSFSKTFTTYIQAEPQPEQRSINFDMVSSDLYHQYRANFSVHSTPQEQGGVLVKYEGHFNMKFGPPPPLGRVMMPRCLQSNIKDMLSQFQQQAVKGTDKVPTTAAAPAGALGTAALAG